MRHTINSILSQKKLTINTVTLDTNGGTALPVSTLIIPQGRTIPTSVNTSVTNTKAVSFIGWTTSNIVWDMYNDPVVEDIEIKAEWFIQERHKLEYPSVNLGTTHLYFGDAMEMSNGIIALGRPSENTVDLIDATTGIVTYTIPNPNNDTLSSDDEFGHAVAINGSTLVVGAPMEEVDDEGIIRNNRGTLYVYDVSGVPTLTRTINNIEPYGGTSDVTYPTWGYQFGMSMSSRYITILNSRLFKIDIIDMNDWSVTTVSRNLASGMIKNTDTHLAFQANQRIYVYDIDGTYLYYLPYVPGVNTQNNYPEYNTEFLALDDTYLYVGNNVTNEVKIYTVSDGNLYDTITNPDAGDSEFGGVVVVAGDYLYISGVDTSGSNKHIYHISTKTIVNVLPVNKYCRTDNPAVCVYYGHSYNLASDGTHLVRVQDTVDEDAWTQHAALFIYDGLKHTLGGGS